MAIALDTSTTGGSASASSLTWSHTCTGSNLVLFVSAYTNTTSVTGITYNGVAMTQVGSTQTYGAINNYLYQLFGPASGSHNIVVSASGSNTVGGTAASYTGVYQGGVDSSNGNTNTATSISVSTTTITDNCWLVCGGTTSASVATSGSNTTVRQSDGSNQHSFIADSNAVQTPAGSHAQAVNCSNNNNAMIVASIAPFDTNPRYWIGGSNTWDNTTKTYWSNSSGGTSGATPPISGNDAVFDANSGASTVTIGAADSCNSLTCTGFTGTLAGSNTLAISGSMTLVAGMTYTFSGAITFNSTSSQTITSAAKTLSNAITFNGIGGTWTLQNALTATGAITVTNGTLALGNFNHSLLSLSNAGTITLGSGTVTLSGTGVVWGNTGTINGATSTIKITDASSSSKTFTGGGSTYNNLWITGSGSGAYTINGSNTFNDFKIDTPPHTVNFAAASTQTLTTFTVSGTAGNLMTLQSTTAGTQWKLRKTTSGTISTDYLSLQDSNVQNL